MIGVSLNSPGLIAVGNSVVTPDGMMILAVIMLTYVFVVHLWGLKYFVKVLWLYWLGVIGACIAIIVSFALNTNATFIISYNSFMAYLNPNIPDFYHYVIDTASKQGVSTSYHFDLFDTFGIGAYGAIVSFIWAEATVGALGEIKRAHMVKDQMVMVTGGAIIAGILMILIGGLVQRVAGFEFLKAAAWGYMSGAIVFPMVHFPAYLLQF